eukprot:TRINITY_DN16340_c0_g1_i1.p2 TRINITY_DN16340_c0_g1~~TRINITY_DN16340_c0_g1_i1.p2  ORF type:complete len:240 (+),score=63.29 TRINITY_DN16340_c0_g1_i1:77-721(+)
MRRAAAAGSTAAGAHRQRCGRPGGQPEAQRRALSSTPPLWREQRLMLHSNQGRTQIYGTLTRGPDWEYADGTMPPRTAVQAHSARNLRAYMESIIEACATVEEMADKNQLPIRPGTENIRRYDPQVPLYLPIDDMIMDERTSPAERHEIYADRAVLAQDAPAPEGPEPVDAATPGKRRRRRVVQVPRPKRFVQGGQEAKPITRGPIDLGHGLAG